MLNQQKHLGLMNMKYHSSKNAVYALIDAQFFYY